MDGWMGSRQQSDMELDIDASTTRDSDDPARLRVVDGEFNPRAGCSKHTYCTYFQCGLMRPGLDGIELD
jgi:hypothetical protein